MAKSNLAVFAKDNKTSSAVVTVAYSVSGVNSVSDMTPQNTQLLMAAGTEGALLTQLKAMSLGTITATQAAIFVRKSTDAANIRKLLSTVLMSAQSVSATTKVSEYEFTIASQSSPLRLEAGDELYFGTAIAQSAGVIAHAAYSDF